MRATLGVLTSMEMMLSLFRRGHGQQGCEDRWLTGEMLGAAPDADQSAQG
ncbi:hypothetical protein ACFYM2_10750 [Streptomyces sp. NPDC006711]